MVTTAKISMGYWPWIALRAIIKFTDTIEVAKRQISALLAHFDTRQKLQ